MLLLPACPTNATPLPRIRSIPVGAFAGPSSRRSGAEHTFFCSECANAIWTHSGVDRTSRAQNGTAAGRGGGWSVRPGQFPDGARVRRETCDSAALSSLTPSASSPYPHGPYIYEDEPSHVGGSIPSLHGSRDVGWKARSFLESATFCSVTTAPEFMRPNLLRSVCRTRPESE